MISIALPVLVLGILGTLAIAAKGTAARARMTPVEIRTTTKIITKKNDLLDRPSCPFAFPARSRRATEAGKITRGSQS